MTKQSNSPNSKKERIFEAEPRDVMMDFYDIIESEHSIDDVRALIEEDPDFYDSYSYVADELRKEGKESEARKLEDEAFNRALQTITDKKGEWPDELPWGWLENRHIVRALMRGADNHWIDGNLEETLNLYRKLLKTNLGDNIGARYAIIALRLGLGYDEYMRQVWPEPMMSHEHIENWFNEHVPKFPEELEEWRKYNEEDPE